MGEVAEEFAVRCRVQQYFSTRVKDYTERNTYVIRFRTRIVLAVAGIYLVILLVLWTMQERISFPAPRAPLPDPATTIGSGERIELTSHRIQHTLIYLGAHALHRVHEDPLHFRLQ